MSLMLTFDFLPSSISVFPFSVSLSPSWTNSTNSFLLKKRKIIELNQRSSIRRHMAKLRAGKDCERHYDS